MLASPNDASSERDTNVTFTCSAMGGPDNKFEWTRLFDNAVVGMESNLTVTVDSARVGGDYRCTVENDAGSDSTTATLRGRQIPLHMVHCTKQ